MINLTDSFSSAARTFIQKGVDMVTEWATQALARLGSIRHIFGRSGQGGVNKYPDFESIDLPGENVTGTDGPYQLAERAARYAGHTP